MPRYVSIWFPYLLAEYEIRKNAELRAIPFVLASPQRGKMIVDAVNNLAAQKGIRTGMVLADCKAVLPELHMIPSKPGKAEQLLNALAEWSIRYTPFATVDLPNGILLDSSGCAHLWGGELKYAETIKSKLASYGYSVKITISDTIGTAWGMARYGNEVVIKSGQQRMAIGNLPPAALRLEPEVLARLKKLGFQRIDSFMDIPNATLRRRFGASLPLRLGQALGREPEMIIPVKPVEPYFERLSSMEPIAAATGIRIALENLIEKICIRFSEEGLGLRTAVFKAYRVDGDMQQLEIGTVYPSRNPKHVFKLFEHKIATLEPALGFEVFAFEALKTERITEEQHAFWNNSVQNDLKISELLDKVSAKTSGNAVVRFLPTENYWPEHSVKEAVPLWEKPSTAWRTDWPRPVHLLSEPEPIQVTAALPDNPPMLFRYKGKLYNVAKSDGPERIEQEWWHSDGLYRDYYCVEDEIGARYWVFRSGPYDKQSPKWFLHGFFA